ncbi:MAG: hypothetical protein A3F40_04900 [Chlamydiae bacterium RIFCSPHIGHO2_12_FULL_27_8]|nr:MAG: hypothetical protein A3F40_04900 [Chlamydiae bacterium RIFCSPHIGHO2_12_FULL_27_8]
MVKFNELLSLRLRSKEKPPKMSELAERSNDGNLSSFSGVFKLNKLNSDEKAKISNILESFKIENSDTNNDLDELIKITSEVKAITNQAVILHGERVKKAQEILKKYKEGAFSAWLMSTYGNRQTPYNFLQYYEFYMTMPNDLRGQIDAMPRQAIYTLASRDGDPEKKQDIIKNYQGQPKQELLSIIRKLFPLSQSDKRQPNIADGIITTLQRLKASFSHPLFSPTDDEKNQIKKLLENLNQKLF